MTRKRFRHACVVVLASSAALLHGNRIDRTSVRRAWRQLQLADGGAVEGSYADTQCMIGARELHRRQFVGVGKGTCIYGLDGGWKGDGRQTRALKGKLSYASQ